MNSPVPHSAWEAYLRLQPLAASPLSGPIPSGRDEALSALLDDFAAGRLPADPEGIGRRFATLAANRAAKHRRRARLARALADQATTTSPHGKHIDEVATREVVALVRRPELAMALSAAREGKAGLLVPAANTADVTVVERLQADQHNR